MSFVFSRIGVVLFVLSLLNLIVGEEVRVTTIDPPKRSASATALSGLFAYIAFDGDIIGYRNWESISQKSAKGDKDRTIPRGTTLGVPLAKWPIPTEGIILVKYLGFDEWYGAEFYVWSTAAKTVPSTVFMNLEKATEFLKSDHVPESTPKGQLTSDQGIVNFVRKSLDERFGAAFSSVMGVHQGKEKVPLVNLSVNAHGTMPQDISDLVLGLLSGDVK